MSGQAGSMFLICYYTKKLGSGFLGLTYAFHFEMGVSFLVNLLMSLLFKFKAKRRLYNQSLFEFQCMLFSSNVILLDLTYPLVA